MKASFPINEHEFTADFSFYGMQRYYLNGALLYKKWSLKTKSSNEFLIDGQRIRINLCAWPNYFCKVYLNNELYIEELFPKLKSWTSSHATTAAIEANRIQVINEKINQVDIDIRQTSEVKIEDKDSLHLQQQKIFRLNENKEKLIELRDRPKEKWFAKIINPSKDEALTALSIGVLMIALFWSVYANSNDSVSTPVKQCEPKVVSGTLPID